ncbi:MAG TPA: diguanylate cyclase [Gammaproteobacteria bacterium]|nr:diguanylate cyclase [Gammaproteobacteria bacterium]
MHILFIEHSKVFRTLWDRTAIRLGHEPMSVASAEEGLEVLRGRRVDLICVALTLPGMDGAEFCRHVRRQPQLRNIPIILLTSSDDKNVRQRSFEAGATEIIDKKDLEALFGRIKRLARETTQKISGRVLYVEDSSVVAHVMLKILKEMNLEVDHFRSADEALKAFESANYDLIISDIVVEGQMSGMGLVSHIREMASDKSRVPILAVSGMDDTARRIELFRLGVNDFITKPVIREEVMARVTNLITSKQLFDQVKMQQKHLYELAMIDPLTGLYNRNSLNEFASKYFLEATRHDFDLSLLLIDIDHFKRINDTHGHLTGDIVLEEIGGMLKRFCRQEDFAARFGGEEFLVIMPHCNEAAALAKGEQIRQQIAMLKPAGLDVTASVGVAARPKGEVVTMETLFRVADEAVYAAKEQGRNRVVAGKL